jgi:hypothetical protein
MVEKTLYKPFAYKGNGNFKYSVYVKDGKIIHFGDKRYQDFRQHKDEKRRKSYLARAKGITNKAGNKTWTDKNTKNYWSVHYLWNG